MNETIYYKSPLGALRIRNESEAISELSFANTGDKITLNEHTLQLTSVGDVNCRLNYERNNLL